MHLIWKKNFMKINIFYNFMTEINLNLLNKIKQLNGASRTSYLSRNKSLMIAESDPKNKTPIIKNSEKIHILLQ